MRLKKNFIVLLTCCLGAAACKNDTKQSNTGEPVSLTFNFQPGSTYEYILDNKLSLQSDINGNTLTIMQDMKIMSAYDVINNTGKNKNIEVTYNRITMRSGNGIINREFDSDDTASNDPIFSHVRDLVNKPFGITVSELGNITQVRGFGNNNADQDILGDSSIRKMMVQCLSVYPAAAVKPGDSWKRDVSSSVGFIHMRLNSTYTLITINKGIAYIDVLSRITPEDTTAGIGFTGSQKGKLEMDIASGLILQGNITQDLEGQLPMAGRLTPVKATSEINIFGSKKQ